MGRLIAVVLFIAVLVPGVLLARAWWLASGQRAVAVDDPDAAEAVEPPAEERERVLVARGLARLSQHDGDHARAAAGSRMPT